MSVFRQSMKDVVQHSQRAAFAELASKPSQAILLEHWLQKELSVRAPEGSVLLVEIQGEHLTALVVDVATEQPRWRITAPRALLAPLYDGMLGSPSAREDSLLFFAATPSGRVDPGKRG